MVRGRNAHLCVGRWQGLGLVIQGLPTPNFTRGWSLREPETEIPAVRNRGQQHTARMKEPINWFDFKPRTS